MRIRLIANLMSERLIWQHRILQYQNQKSFQLTMDTHMTLNESSEMVEEEATAWVINDEESFNQLLSYEALPNERSHLLIILSLAFERGVESETLNEMVLVCLQKGDELLLESEYQTAVLFQRLFKPRTKRQIQAFYSKEPVGVEETVALSYGAAPQDRPKPWAEMIHSKIRQRMAKPTESTRDQHKPNFPRIKICVYGHAALAYEIAAVISKDEGRQVLVMDLDRFTPTADIYLGVRPLINQTYDFFTKVSATGLNVLLDCAKKGIVQRETFLKCTQPVKDFPNCHVLTGVYQLGDYEYYKAEDVAALVDKAAGYYDVVILKTNNYPYDGFTLMAMSIADAVVSSIPPRIESARAQRQLITLLEDKQRILIEKQAWVIFESKPINGMELGFLKSLSEGLFLGKIPRLEERDICQLSGEPYLKKCYEKLLPIYQPVIKQIYKRVVSV